VKAEQVEKQIKANAEAYAQERLKQERGVICERSKPGSGSVGFKGPQQPRGDES
jgi:hypothetical protein